jgi:hypothetical protein
VVDYKGFSLIEFVTVHPPCRAGRHGISVHDELVGVVSDHPTIELAKLWIDQQIQLADGLLAELVKRS